MVFVQYDRTQHGRMQSHKLSSDGIQPSSLEMFAASSYTRVSLSQLRFRQLGEIGPIPLTIGPIHLTLCRPPTIQSEVVFCRRPSFPPVLWRNSGSQLRCLYCRHLPSAKKNPVHGALMTQWISCMCAPVVSPACSPVLATAALSPRILACLTGPAACRSSSIIPCMTHASTVVILAASRHLSKNWPRSWCLQLIAVLQWFDIFYFGSVVFVLLILCQTSSCALWCRDSSCYTHL